MLIMDKSKNIFFWSPFLSNVGTKLAVTNSIEILKDKTKNKIFLINLMGEFEDFSYKGVKNYFSKYQKFFTSKWIIIKNLNMDYKYYIYTLAYNKFEKE